MIIYFRIDWEDWRGNNSTITVQEKDVVKFVAILLNSLTPKTFTVTRTTQE